MNPGRSSLDESHLERIADKMAEKMQSGMTPLNTSGRDHQQILDEMWARVGSTGYNPMLSYEALQKIRQSSGGAEYNPLLNYENLSGMNNNPFMI